MHERRYNAGVERLRRPERLERMEVPAVTDAVLAGIESSTVLDVGTGSGLFAEAFASRGRAVTGIDPNFEMLEAARSFVPSGSFHSGTVEAIPFPDRSFDIVFLGHVLHESDDIVQSLKECRRTASKRCAILEWPYVEEEIGPPLAHRLPTSSIHSAAKEAGWSSVRDVRFKQMILTILE